MRFRALSVLSVIALTGAAVFTAGPAAYADTAPAVANDPANPTTVSADPLPTVQIDGVAWAQTVVGDVVYVVGDFATARPAGAPAGQNTVPRNNMLAYNINTGELIQSFDLSFNAQVLNITVSPDKSRLYVVGDFDRVDDVPYYRVAAISTATGQVIPSFRPILSSQARAVAASNDTVYVGGTMTTVDGQPRRYLAAMDAASGQLRNWTADTDAVVDALTLTKDGSKLIVGGRFTTIAGIDNYGLGAVNAATGAVVPWAANQVVRNAGSQASITSLFATEDRVYGTGYDFVGPGGNLEGSFSADPDTGEIVWVEDCHGDSYSIWANDTTAYIAGHPHYCGNIGGFPQTEPWTFYHSLAFSKAATGTITADPYGYFNFEGTPSPTLLNWFPKWVTGTYTGMGQATWSVAGNDQYVVYGGEFPYVNSSAQQGLVRFAVPSIAPNKSGPNVNDQLIPKAVSYAKGEARISWLATSDRDNTRLTYELVRDGDRANPVYTTTVDSTFWQRPSMGFIDTGLTPGSTHSYRLYVTDPWGNSVSRLGNTVTISADGGSSEYADAVKASAPTSYFPLDESFGATGYNRVGFDDLTLGDGVSRGADGPVAGIPASVFNGSSSGFGVTSSAVEGPQTFTVEAWVKTTSRSGGKIIGFGSSPTGNSGSYDRQVYMGRDGRLTFGVYPGDARTVTTANAYNDGEWHQVVASLGADGMRLYVDGKLEGARSDTTSAQAYSGYWRVGGDNLSGWPNRPPSDYFAGDIAQVAVYDSVLPRTAVVEHYVASGRQSPMAPEPADAYGKAVYSLDPTLYWRMDESSGSTAADSGPNEKNGQYQGDVTFGTAGAIVGGSERAVQFDAGAVVAETRTSNPSTYSLETWFSTTSNRGGKLIGFGNSASGLSSSYDRHVYMQDDGRLVFGTWTGATNTITTPQSYNDGKWHQVVATQGPAGMKLYVDGELVGENPQTGAQAYDGYWRIGGDTTWGSSSPYFAGSLDEVAVYPTQVDAGVVQQHYVLGTTGKAPNQLPSASFTTQLQDLTVAVDGTASSDPDGSIASYRWDFGDGETADGPTASHAYQAAGSYPVTLTVTDDGGATASSTSTVEVTEPPNLAPTAVFASTVDNLTASFDGSGSSDADGSVASYAWDFGDGSTGSGVTAARTYAAAGTYSVSLTVTDDDGATSVETASVTVAADPVAGVLAQDDFERTVTGGWGAADAGGRWLVSGGSSSILSVSSGAGRVASGVGSTRNMVLDGVSVTDADLSLRFALDALPTGSGDYTSVIARQVGSANYLVRTWVRPDGSVTLVVTRSGSVLRAVQVPGLTYRPGDELAVRVQVSGTSPTTVNAKVWQAAGAEPADWQATVTDSAAALQAAGAVGVQTYLATSATTRVTTLVEEFSATTAGEVPANAAPTAAFTSTVTGREVQVDGSGSSDADGSVASYAWDFGDGSTGSGVTAARTYAAAGTYSVSLTVTDDDGATSVETASVTVAADRDPVQPENSVPVASFTSAASGLAAAFDGTASSDADGAITAYAWDFGDGVTGEGPTAEHAYAAAGTYTVTLTVTDSAGATASASDELTVTGDAPPVDPNLLATDSFERTVQGGWGEADLGAAWRVTGNPGILSVSGGAGQVASAPGSTRVMALDSVSSTATDVQLTFALDAIPTGGGSYTTLIGRSTGGQTYAAQAWIRSNGQVYLVLSRSGQTLAVAPVAGLTYSPGLRLTMRTQTVGTSPTTVQAKVWLADGAEPGSWQLSTTDTTPELQVPGAVAVRTYLAGSATSGVRTFVDDLVVRRVGGQG